MPATSFALNAVLAMGMITANAAEQVITILHTNDIHGQIAPWRGWEVELTGKTIGGVDRLASAIKQVRTERGANVLLLDAGDAIGDTMIAHETRHAAVLKLMNALGYDAMTIGNHEPDFGTARLRELIDPAKFPVLAANIRGKSDGALFTKPYLIREIAGVKIGLIGFAYPNTPQQLYVRARQAAHRRWKACYLRATRGTNGWYSTAELAAGA